MPKNRYGSKMYYEDCEIVILKTSFVREYQEPAHYSLCFMGVFLDASYSQPLAHPKQIMKLTTDP